MTNQMSMEFDSKSENESFARVVAASFATQLNPNLEEIDDIKTVVSEAVTNSIIHGYQMGEGKIFMECKIEGNDFHITIMDKGVGIGNVEQAMEPMFTTRPELERSGMGFIFMKTLMDDIEVISEPDIGTTVKMSKRIYG
ncbi:MAG: anti-sigma F factor [Lachnospiraceae bacterium]|nr:anti-sigma F factor [Lachnospiraceae bacterium]